MGIGVGQDEGWKFRWAVEGSRAESSKPSEATVSSWHRGLKAPDRLNLCAPGQPGGEAQPEQLAIES